MKCRKHPADRSCNVGVCASCLRERLVAVIAVQAQAQALKQALQDCRKSDSQPISFPRSVSPYISRRKSDAVAAAWRPLFYSTPRVGNKDDASFAVEVKSSGKSGFSSLFRGLFRSKPGRKPDFDADPVPDPTVSVNSCSASPAWLPNIISGRRKKKVSTFSLDDSSIGSTNRHRGRGMSPVRNADHEDEHCPGGSSGNSSDSQGWRQTPRRTPASTRRGGGGGGGKAATHSKSISGLTFCLSPLLRPSPNRHWNQKVAPPESVAGDPRATPKPYLSTAASFCKNRSRKLADFGRFPFDPTY